MSAEPGEEAPVELSDRPPRLNPWVTGAALGILVILAVLIFWPSHGLDTLERPEESLERVVAGDMDFRAAARRVARWERRVYTFMYSTDHEARIEAIGWYEEMVRVEGSPLAELYRIILLAEDGQADAVEAALDSWTPGDDWAGRVATWARAAYGADMPSADELRSVRDALHRELAANWFTDRLALRLGVRLSDAGAAEAEGRILARGNRMLGRMRTILAVETVLVVLGLAALAAWLAGPGRVASVAVAPIPPRWSVAEGVGLFARGAVSLGGVALVWPLLPDSAWSALLVSGLSAVPLGGYLFWLCGWSGTSLAETFGLRVRRADWRTLLQATLALVGVSTLADVLTDLAGSRLGVETHWTDGFQERLVWGTRGDVIADILDSCVMAPVVEELLFRGVLYGTLRLRLGPLPATVVSAGLFALAHGYGVVGFASVFASGVLWAVAYERTRSLLPGMLTHAASNVQATAIVLATLRF
jgi:membrane protease YdiL (CAAX protease family)